MFRTIRIGALEYTAAEVLEGCPHGFSTRLGGVSEGYLSAMNLGHHRGDLPENVEQNYAIFGQAVGFTTSELVFTRQEHTDIVRVVTAENCGEGLYRSVPEVCDALITDNRRTALVTFAADCTPILFYDPVRQAIGAAHAGWRGTAMGIAAKTVDAMVRTFGCKRENIRAAIGPNIGKCCFETDHDVPDAMLASLGEEASLAIAVTGDKYHVDLKFCNELWLRRAGVRQIDVSPACTACDPVRYWSHRKVGGHRGSMAAIILLK